MITNFCMLGDDFAGSLSGDHAGFDVGDVKCGVGDYSAELFEAIVNIGQTSVQGRVKCSGCLSHFERSLVDGSEGPVYPVPHLLQFVIRHTSIPLFQCVCGAKQNKRSFTKEF